MAVAKHKSDVSSESPIIRGERALTIEKLVLPRVEDLTAGGFGMVDFSSSPSVSSVDDLLEEAQDQGYRQGFSKGLKQGESSANEKLEIAELKLSGLTSVLDSALAQLKAAAGAGLRASEADIASFSLKLAEEILGHESQLGAARVRLAVAKALEGVDPRVEVTARVSPEEYPALKEIFETSAQEAGTELNLIADPAVERSGVILEVGATRIDAQISTALQRVKDVLGELGGSK